VLVSRELASELLTAIIERDVFRGSNRGSDPYALRDEDRDAYLDMLAQRHQRHRR
jgi:hypothetical protein